MSLSPSGAGFIGSLLIRHLVESTTQEVLNFDKLTYAGTLSTMERVANEADPTNLIHQDTGRSAPLKLRAVCSIEIAAYL